MGSRRVGPFLCGKGLEERREIGDGEEAVGGRGLLMSGSMDRSSTEKHRLLRVGARRGIQSTGTEATGYTRMLDIAT